MDPSRALRYAGFAFGAALCAALLAHVAIDAAGDYLLAHDSYDDIAHGSRALVASTVLGLLVLWLFSAAGTALRRARGSERALCAGLRDACPPQAWAFALAVTGLAFAIVAAMEGLDVALAGGHVDDLGDLLGGSLVLGGFLTLVCATATAVAARFGLRRLARLGRIARRVVAFLRRRAPRASFTHSRRPRRRSRASARYVARRLAGRAPPPLLIATTA